MGTLHRIKNDTNGNPRFVVHFTDLEPSAMRDANRAAFTLPERYARVLTHARKLGGRKFHNKTFGGGVVFQAYECQMADIVSRIQSMQGGAQA